MLPGGSEADWGPADVNPGPRAGDRRRWDDRRRDPDRRRDGRRRRDRAAARAARRSRSRRRPASCASAAASSRSRSAARAAYDAKLTLKGRTVARKKGSAEEGGATVAIKLSAKQARAVRKLGRGSKALKLVVVAKSGGAAATRSVTVAPR